MEEITTKSHEGIWAYVNALQAAQDGLSAKRLESIESVRRITHSLQQFPSFTKVPHIKQALADIQRARDEEVGTQLNALLPELGEWVQRTPALKTSVLLVEDDPIINHLLNEQLRSSHRQIYAAKSIKEAEKYLNQKEVSLIVLDLVLPDGDGRDLITRVRDNPLTAHIPIIVLSAKNGNDAKTECFALGVDAYFDKPFEPVALATAVAARLQRQADFTRQSSLDPVTHLPNRIVFYSAFARAARLASRSGEPLSVALLDMDRFKSVNDISGHQMGDRVLQRTSALLLKTLRTSDLLARWGGEEFAILFPNTDLSQARLALNKALEALRKQVFETPEGRQFRMTFSAGVTQVEEGSDVEHAIAEADRYLYLAKAAGRNHVLSKDDRLDNLKRNILLVEDDEFMASLLRRFLEKEGFRIFHAKDGKDALGLCSQAAFSLITLDIKLPDIDGFDLLARFRQTPTIRNVPIIMLTSTSNEENVIRGFKLGADDYIVKPFSPSEFLARVHRFLEKQA